MRNGFQGEYCGGRRVLGKAFRGVLWFGFWSDFWFGFGPVSKIESGAVGLDPQMMSPHPCYQFPERENVRNAHEQFASAHDARLRPPAHEALAI